VQQSNSYIIIFSVILTVVLGGLLALAAVGLGPIQQVQIDIDTRRSILNAVMDVSQIDKADITSVYEQKIESIVVNRAGEIIEVDEEGNPLIAEKVDIAKQFKIDPDNRLYPVFQFMDENNPDEVEAYIVPVYGNGLWDNIWGYIALEKDLETIRGVVLDHAGETPGLGARITSVEVQRRFVGKKIYNDIGELVAVTMMKGETGDPSIYNANQVDGISGSTITANGVNNMLKNYLTYYEGYFNKVKGGVKQSAANL